MEFITTGNRIAVENFSIGKVYTIVWATGNYKSLACVGKGSDFVMFQDQAPDLLFCLTMDTAIAVESIDEGGGGAGTMNYNELENKPSINGIVLVGNKTGADLNLVSQADLDDYATNASVVAGLATKQDALSSSQLAAVNSGITSELVTQIGTNTSAIAGKQDALSSSQLAAVNSGITSTDVAQITTNKNNILTIDETIKNQLPPFNTNFTPTAEVSTSYDINGWLDVDITGTVSADTTISVYGGYFMNTLGGLNLYYDIGGTSNVQINVVYSNNGVNAAYTAQNVSSGYTISDSYPYVGIFIIIKTGATQDFKFKAMACTSPEYTADSTFTRFAPNNLLLYKLIKALQ